MQALAEEAGVSVGLIYRYFGSKEDLLFAVILDVLESYLTAVPEAVAAAGADPVDQLVAGFRAYCEVLESHRSAAVLTYRASRELGPEGIERLKELEVDTAAPFRKILAAGSDIFLPLDAELTAYNLVMLAHAWALKHWYYERLYTFDQYVAKQTALTLRSILPRRRWLRAARRHGLDETSLFSPDS